MQIADPRAGFDRRSIGDDTHHEYRQLIYSIVKKTRTGTCLVTSSLEKRLSHSCAKTHGQLDNTHG